jgi:hypothetical protein
VYPEAALADEVVKVLDPHAIRVVYLERAARLEPAGVDREHERVEQRTKGLVERAIDKQLWS